MRSNFFLIILLLFYCCHSDIKKAEYNLDFEILSSSDSLPKGWFIWNGSVKTDFSIYRSGNKSIAIFEGGKDNYGAFAQKIENKYKGKEIILEGYIRTENITKGFAGLILRLDNAENVLEFQNMQSENINGTNDWKKYTIKVPFHDDCDYIYVGAMMQGTGTAWFDSFKVYIDGVEIEDFHHNKDSPVINQSNIKLHNLTETQINNLCKLGEKWSYLKYNSAIIAKGNIDWDVELFNFLPNIYKLNFDAELRVWSTKFDSRSKFDKNYYVDFHQDGNPIFKNESAYSSMVYHDDGLKVLALFRYWSMIEYFYPYKHLLKNDWNTILRKYIPKIINCRDELSYKLCILELTAEISDSHAEIYDFGNDIEEFYGTNKVPIEARFVENKLVVVQNGWVQELSIGDVITDIGDQKVEDIILEKLKYEQASNQVGLLRNLSFKILRTNNASLSLTVERNKMSKKIKVDIDTVPQSYVIENLKNSKSHKILEGEIGYINPEFLKKNEIDDIMNKFLDKKAVIIDLRNYPSDFIVYSLSKYLIYSPTIFAKFSQTSFKHLGKFSIGQPLKVGEHYKQQFIGKVAVLVDEMTQSNAEFTVMALSTAKNLKIVGSQTAGADGNISEIILPGNLKTTITGLGVLYPDNTETQRKGVKVDIAVKKTLRGIRNNEDEVLNSALKYINQ